MGHYIRGRCVKTSAGARREYGSYIPKTMIDNVVTVSTQFARLCRKGILFVRMKWTMRVCVVNDSTNQPV